MYSFTKLEASIKKLKANGNFHCACCQKDRNSEPVIKQGEDFFWITGHRTYKCIQTVWKDNFPSNELAPYIPWQMRKKLRQRKIEASEFKDLITTHKICPKCFRKLSVFVGYSVSSVIKYDNVYFVKDRYTFRSYGSLKDYNCATCGVAITPGTVYVRQGILTKYCNDCIKPIEGLIGTEYSY